MTVGDAVGRSLTEPLYGGGVIWLAIDTFGVKHGKIVHGFRHCPWQLRPDTARVLGLDLFLRLALF